MVCLTLFFYDLNKTTTNLFNNIKLNKKNYKLLTNYSKDHQLLSWFLL